MSRLFITQREIDFINDLAKEVIKDVVGQKVYLYNISREKSKVHDVYHESIDKVAELPIELDALVDWQQSEVAANEYGIEQSRTIKVYLSARDLRDKGVQVFEGDFVSYGSQMFEITSAVSVRNIYGQIEYTDGIELLCKEARASQFTVKKLHGPKDEVYVSEPENEKFSQQRGFAVVNGEETGDVRALRERGVLEDPITGPKEVTPDADDTGANSFYGEE